MKDAFHDYVVRGRADAVNPRRTGTKAAALYRLAIPAGETAVLSLRLAAEDEAREPAFGRGFEEILDRRRREADEFYDVRIPEEATEEERRVVRQAYAGLLWSKQYYHYVVKDWQLRYGGPGSTCCQPEVPRC